MPLQLFVKNETLEDLNIKALMVTTKVIHLCSVYIYVCISLRSQAFTNVHTYVVARGDPMTEG